MKILFFLFFLVFSITSCFSQNVITPFLPLNINDVTFDKRTSFLFQDSMGYLWIGTLNGLYKYNGYEIEEFQYNVFNDNSLPNNNINSILEDNHKNLWLGSESYLVCYDRANDLFKGFYKDKTSRILGKSSDGTVWATTQRTGIVKIEPDTIAFNSKLITEFNYKEKNNVLISKTKINQHLEDNYKRNWFATSKGIIALDKNFNHVFSNFLKNTFSIFKGEGNSIISATKKGIYVLEYNKENYDFTILEHYPVKNINNKRNTNLVLNNLTVESNNKTLWIGTNIGLLKGVRKNGKYEFAFVEGNKNSTNQINVSLLDNFGNLWLGSQRGVSKLIGKSSIFKNHNFGSDLANAFSSCIFSEKENQLLISFKYKYLYRYNIKSREKEQFLNISKKVFFIEFDNSKENLFIGHGNELIKTLNYSNNKLKPKTEVVKSYNKSVIDVIEFQNNIWVGLWGGGIDIIKEKGSLTSFEKKIVNTLSNTNVYEMLLDANNNLWIGTRGDGLYKINTKEKIIYHLNPNKNGLKSNAILSLTESDNGDVWIGTRGGGLNLYKANKDSIVSFDKSHGLLSNTISGIREDVNGNIWLSTDSGISFLNKSTGRFINFGVDDGIINNQFSFNVNSAQKNKLFFGTIGGFYEVNTNNFQINNSISNTVITDFSIFGNNNNDENIKNKNQALKEKLRGSKPINLSYTDNNLVIKFSSLDLTSPIKNKYAYKLEGVNNFWINTDGSNRTANYNNLPHGQYTFKVKSTNSSGVWNEKPISLKFSIEPPFWKSNFAIFGYYLLAFIMLYISFLLIRKWYRLKKNLVAETVSRQKDNEYHRMRMIFFTDISHELRTPLTLIRGTVEKAINDNNFTLNTISANRIYNNIIRMNKLINQIMDIRKHDSGKFKLRISENNLNDNLTKIKNNFNDLARVNNINYNLESKIKLSEAYYDMQILEKVLFNLLSNAFKYTPDGGKITINATSLKYNKLPKNIVGKLSKGTYLKCVVKDSGTGISEQDLPYIFNRFYQGTKIITNQIPGTGIGMELVHKLINLHNGYIEVRSEKQKFTEFTFFLPIDKEHYSESNLITLNHNKDLKSRTKTNIQVINELVEGEKSNEKIESGKPKILLVEDNQEILNFLAEGLENEFKIIKARNGKQGYDFTIKHKPKLILSDILMPEEDGVSMLKRIKENKNISHIPIFILSANGFEETKLECIKLGADDFIDKPFSLEFVRWKIKNNVQKRSDLKERYSRIVSINPSEVKVESPDDKFMRKLVKIIEGSIDDNLLSVEFLASEVGVSRASLYRKLQSIAAISPVEFIKQIRLKRAAQLLKNDSLYVSEIAHMTGFNNLKYFSKCFKKEFGITPTNYKKEQNKIFENSKYDS